MSSVATTQSTSLTDALNAATNATSSPDSQQTTANGTPIVSGPKPLGQADFLNLMIAQLQNQDPMKPMDNQAFVAEMAQFSQLDSTNQLVTLMQQNNNDLEGAKQVGLVSLIGHQINVSGATVNFDGSTSVPVNYTLAASAASVNVNILDANNNVIKTIAVGGQGAGNEQATWDGTDNNGLTVSPGTYGFSVTAQDSAGQTVTATPLTIETVTGVQNNAGKPMLLVGSQQVDPSTVLAVY